MKSNTTIKKLIIASAAIGCATQVSHAQTWDAGTTGNWNDNTNWSGDTLPGTGSTAYVNDGTAIITDSQQITNLYPGWGAGTTGTVRIDTGGSLYVTGNSNPGQTAGATGIINVNGGTLTIDGSMNAGHQGDATIQMNAGSLIVKGATILSESWAGSGNFNVTGGTLATKSIGIDSNESFGGTLSIGAIGSAGGLELRSASPLDFNMTNTAAMRFDIGGTSDSTAFDAGSGFYDRLIVNPNVNLNLGGSRLDIYVVDGFENDSITISGFNQDIININTTGTFGNVIFGERLNTADGKGSFIVTRNGSNGIHLSDWVAIPEPGTYALLAGLTGLSLVALRRRRSFS
jgi:hypothetical protein